MLPRRDLVHRQTQGKMFKVRIHGKRINENNGMRDMRAKILCQTGRLLFAHG
jgi:hypothetical protein